MNRQFRILSALLLLSILIAACSSPGSDDPDPTNPVSGEEQAATTPISSDGDGAEDTPSDGGIQPTQASTDGTVSTQIPSTDAPTDVPNTDPAASTTEPAPTGPPPSGESLLPGHRIISFYGHPSTPTMGVLGAGTKEELLVQLQEQAAEFAAVDPDTPNKLAFEIIATVAQPNPGPEGTYLLYTGDEWIGEYVDFATANDMIVILDLQIGHNTVTNEINQVRHWLELPNVHVALDPEFATAANDIPRPDRVPGSLIGEISGYQVMEAVNILAEIAAQNNIPNKILIVHQFEEEMIYEKHAVTPTSGVDIVVDMDGFGTPENKLGGYQHYVTEELIQYGGIKLFYDQDVPLLDPATLVGLNPPPVVVIYQ